MRRWTAVLLILVAVPIALGASYAGYRYVFRQTYYANAGELPEMVREALSKSRSLRLYSLDPSIGAKDYRGFHGWTVLGEVTLEGAAATAAREAVAKGIQESKGDGAKCFEPRHGLRAGSVDLVICFECFHVYAYQGWDRAYCVTTEAPARVLNQLLSGAGIPLPAPSKH